MEKSPIARFYGELKRRKVLRVGAVYAVVSWVVVEIASVMFPELLLPDWSVRLVIALLVIGFPVALVLAAVSRVRLAVAPAFRPRLRCGIRRERRRLHQRAASRTVSRRAVS